MDIKKILKIATFSFAIITIVVAIITLVNYYSYASVLEKLQSTDIDLLTKFELQEDRDTYLYRTLRLTPWALFLSLATSSLACANTIANINRNFQKIR